MKILIGQFSHESNCFSGQTTGEAAFRQWELVWGDDVLAGHMGKRTVLGGFLDGLEGHQVIGSVSAMAVPSGPVEAAFYRRVCEDLLESIRQVGDLDGILLSLHGAMSVAAEAGVVDPEGDLVAAVRALVGPGVPVAVVLDLHSDTTDLLVENADLTLAYNEEPHRDGYERGREAAELVLQIIDGRICPVAVRQRVPMLLPAINMATDRGPMRELHALRAELETTPGVIDISLHPGFYGADQPEVGFSVVCTTDGDPELARAMAGRVAMVAWRKREEFVVPLTPIEAAVRQALATPGPVGLIDEADDPAGGGSGDSVAILRGMLVAKVRSGGVSTVKDAEVVAQMVLAGEGATVETLLGGKTDSLHGEPLAVRGRVVRISRDRIPTDSWSGRTYDVGTLGVLDVDGILVVVTETKIVAENFDIFEILGFDVRQMEAVVFKGLGLHIRQALAHKIETFIAVDGVGVTHPDVRRLGPYRRVRRPVWPLDPVSLDEWPDWGAACVE